MFRSTKEGRGSRRYRVVAVVGLAVALASGAGLVTAAGASSKVTLTIWNDPLAAGSVGVPASKSFLTKGVDLFEKANPNIDVKIMQEPMASSTAFDTLLQSAELAGTTPDIGQLYVGGQVIQNAKFLDPLEQRLLGQSYINSLTGWQFVTKNYATKRHVYAVPYGAGYYYTVYYNKKDFAKAGITDVAHHVDGDGRRRAEAKGQGHHALRVRREGGLLRRVDAGRDDVDARRQPGRARRCTPARRRSTPTN